MTPRNGGSKELLKSKKDTYDHTELLIQTQADLIRMLLKRNRSQDAAIRKLRRIYLDENFTVEKLLDEKIITMIASR